VCCCCCCCCYYYYYYYYWLGYQLDDRGSRVRIPAGAGNFSLHHRVQTGSGAHPACYPMGTGGSFPGVKRLGCEADLHLVPRSKNEWRYTSTPQYAFMAWCSVKKAQGQLYFTLHLPLLLLLLLLLLLKNYSITWGNENISRSTYRYVTGSVWVARTKLLTITLPTSEQNALKCVYYKRFRYKWKTFYFSWVQEKTLWSLDNWLVEARGRIRRVKESSTLSLNGRMNKEIGESSWWCRHLWGKMLSFASQQCNWSLRHLD
jgi:hypothetical protein